jgi:hypothetical protein
VHESSPKHVTWHRLSTCDVLRVYYYFPRTKTGGLRSLQVTPLIIPGIKRIGDEGKEAYKAVSDPRKSLYANLGWRWYAGFRLMLHNRLLLRCRVCLESLWLAASPELPCS